MFALGFKHTHFLSPGVFEHFIIPDAGENLLFEKTMA